MFDRGSGRTSALVPVPPSGSQEMSTTIMAHGWPLRNFLELGAYPGAVPCARLHTRAVLWEWGLAGLGESAELVVSEIVTNAVQASRELDSVTPVWLWLLANQKQVLILVWDASPRPPAPAESSGEVRESGRGLLLVDAISEQWSSYPVQAMGGKVVWALCAETDA